MPYINGVWYTEEQVADWRRAEDARRADALTAWMHKIENRPQQERDDQEWQAGREFAKHKGFRGESLEKLEGFMVTERIPHHRDAISRGVIQPDNRLFGLNAEADEIQLMLEKGDDAALHLSIPRALRGE